MTTLLSAGEVAAWPCMTPEEYELWRQGGTAKNPCVDCPAWFEAQQRSVGRCSRETREHYAIRRAQESAAARRYRQRVKLAARNRRYRATLRAQVEAVREYREQGCAEFGCPSMKFRRGEHTHDPKVLRRRAQWRASNERRRQARCNDAAGGAQ